MGFCIVQKHILFERANKGFGFEEVQERGVLEKKTKGNRGYDFFF